MILLHIGLFLISINFLTNLVKVIGMFLIKMVASLAYDALGFTLIYQTHSWKTKTKTVCVAAAARKSHVKKL